MALEVNGRPVPGLSAPAHLAPGGAFALDIAHAFALTVTRWPDSLRLILYEKGRDGRPRMG